MYTTFFMQTLCLWPADTGGWILLCKNFSPLCCVTARDMDLFGLLRKACTPDVWSWCMQCLMACSFQDLYLYSML